MKNKVMLGMSGGVDSSCAAILLLENGYDVTGVTLKLRDDKIYNNISGGCCSSKDIDDAKKVADKLGINHIVVDLTDTFSQKVIDYFSSEYINGRTPNPCIACNKHIKFDSMLSKAIKLGFDYIATGHYAGIYYDNNINRWKLRKSNCKKDQSYVLYSMTQHQLEHTLFPLVDYEKDAIREIANKHGLCVASKPDSQEICFIPDNDYSKFIKKHTGKDFPCGNFLDTNGNKLGKHTGIINYTVGQRKNLGISLGKRMYVTNINVKDNTVTLGESQEQFKNSLIATNLNFIPFDTLTSPLKIQAKIRYQAPPVPATLIPLSNDTVEVIFDDKQKAISPGQSVVFYDDNDVVGGGIIS